MNKLIIIFLIGFSVIYAKNKTNSMVAKPPIILTETVHYSCVDRVINKVLNDNFQWNLKDIKITSVLLIMLSIL